MTIQARITALAQSVGADIKALFSGKQDALVSGANLKTVNGVSLLGGGDLVIEGGGGGLTLFEESRNTTSPNATVPVHALAALGAETNIDFVIAPKGTGAIVAQVPTGTTVGGNKRGANAVDLQTKRSGANQVASGNGSVLIGTNSTASGASSVAMGESARATGSSAVALGVYSWASGAYSAAIAGFGIAGGHGATAIGKATSTRGVDGALAYGYSNGTGSTQLEQFMPRMNTSDDTPVVLTTSGFGISISTLPVMPNNSAYYCRIRVLARNTATNESMSWSGTALIKRGANAASTTLVGSSIASDFGDAAMSACTVTLSADTTYGALAVIVTGLASTSIRWVAQLETVEAA